MASCVFLLSCVVIAAYITACSANMLNVSNCGLAGAADTCRQPPPRMGSHDVGGQTPAVQMSDCNDMFDSDGPLPSTLEEDSYMSSVMYR